MSGPFRAANPSTMPRALEARRLRRNKTRELEGLKALLDRTEADLAAHFGAGEEARMHGLALRRLAALHLALGPVRRTSGVPIQRVARQAAARPEPMPALAPVRLPRPAAGAAAAVQRTARRPEMTEAA